MNLACETMVNPAFGSELQAPPTLERADSDAPARARVQNRRTADESLPGIAALILGDSPGIRRVRSLVARLAPTELPVHIHGPTGCGKELVARALHLASGRTGKLVAFNVCAIGEGVFEGTLFGHARGAFTGAVADQDGLLLEAHQGTVFLDEIGGLPAGAQAKLLRAIELREFRPVGGRRDRTSQFRTVSATNDDLDALMQRGLFREDLLHRLRGAVISVPPLSERREDIRPIARQQALRLSCGQIDHDALLELERCDWPGNVRELLQVVQCAAALAGDDVLGHEVIREALELRRIPSSAQRGRADASSRELRTTLDANGWDVDATAAVLGLHRATVYRRMRRMDCDQKS